MRILVERSVESLALLHGALLAGTKKVIGWTVSPPANLKVPIEIQSGKRKTKRKVRYDFLTPDQQIRFLVDSYIPKVLRVNIARGVVTFEQNKSGNIHLHGIFYDEGIQNDYAMTSLRKNVMQTGLCMVIAGTNKNRHRVLNYIHFLEDINKWIEYLMKDVDLHDYPIYYFSDTYIVPHVV